jgi:hypothetical protein
MTSAPVIAACAPDTPVDLHGSISTEYFPKWRLAGPLRFIGITDTRSRIRGSGFGARHHAGRALLGARPGRAQCTREDDP